MKNQSTPIAITLSSSLMFFSSGLLAEPHPGKVLLDKGQCMKCHEAKPFDPQKTKDYPQLVKAVNFCNVNLNTGFWDEEVEELADYLNQKYYHYEK
ncbi:hypothetical protein QCB45_01470 [Thiomicrorhabdus sp. ZW0627]|uniref:hypothetical protein n=1 Tax=Thiomicrorhabdus sp. ZW0627 TaxID=3039774 RepID=UPI0024371CB5|nr:hypothetical protein [Thiomicrorhabdus sp. ZW0627]MDG6772984.1 hypothetical protein [Thiomicrorhabdus sp. ZW0627]